MNTNTIQYNNTINTNGGQGHQADLLTAALMRQAAASVTVGTYWPWKPIATLRSALQARSARRR